LAKSALLLLLLLLLLLHYSDSASFRAMASPISFLQPTLFPVAEFLFRIWGKYMTRRTRSGLFEFYSDRAQQLWIL